MLTASTGVENPLTTSDLGPLRRMLGSHSMVVRVNADGTLLPFEIMPELVLGRSIRRLLTGATREAFEAECRRAIDQRKPRAYTPRGVGADGEVMITPVLDNDQQAVRFLLVWARHAGVEAEPPPLDAPVTWSDLSVEEIEIRFRAIGDGRVEAGPWWAVGHDSLALWDHHARVSGVGLAGAAAGELVTRAVETLATHDAVTVRVELPGADMLTGVLPVVHGALRATGVDAARLCVAIPVELACDPDLLPVIVHLRTLGLGIDLVGLDSLTATLHTVSDTSNLEHEVPTPKAPTAGRWTSAATEAVQAALADGTVER